MKSKSLLCSLFALFHAPHRKSQAVLFVTGLNTLPDKNSTGTGKEGKTHFSTAKLISGKFRNESQAAVVVGLIIYLVLWLFTFFQWICFPLPSLLSKLFVPLVFEFIAPSFHYHLFSFPFSFFFLPELADVVFVDCYFCCCCCLFFY